MRSFFYLNIMKIDIRHLRVFDALWENAIRGVVRFREIVVWRLIVRASVGAFTFCELSALSHILYQEDTCGPQYSRREVEGDGASKQVTGPVGHLLPGRQAAGHPRPDHRYIGQLIYTITNIHKVDRNQCSIHSILHFPVNISINLKKSFFLQFVK